MLLLCSVLYLHELQETFLSDGTVYIIQLCMVCTWATIKNYNTLTQLYNCALGSYNKLCHHALLDLTASLPKSQLMVWSQIKNFVVVGIFPFLFYLSFAFLLKMYCSVRRRCVVCLILTFYHFVIKAL